MQSDLRKQACGTCTGTGAANGGASVGAGENTGRAGIVLPQGTNTRRFISFRRSACEAECYSQAG